MGSPYVTSNRGGGRRPQLPAFCRTRRLNTATVSVSSLAGLRLLVLLVLLFQLSTLLLVLAGPVPPRPVISSTTAAFRSAVDVAGGSSVNPLSNR